MDIPDTDTEDRKHTLAAAKICWTAADISGPIPSPGINVTICVYHSIQYKTHEYLHSGKHVKCMLSLTTEAEESYQLTGMPLVYL